MTLTPKQKAEELFSSFDIAGRIINSDTYNIPSKLYYLLAKKSALVCVEEIESHMSSTTIMAGAPAYWKRVKQEIEAL